MYRSNSCSRENTKIQRTCTSCINVVNSQVQQNSESTPEVSNNSRESLNSRKQSNSERGVLKSMESFMKVTRKRLSNIARTLLTPPNKLYDQQRMKNRKGPTNPTYKVWYRSMVFNLTFNNISVISWRSVLLEKEIGVPNMSTIF